MNGAAENRAGATTVPDRVSLEVHPVLDSTNTMARSRATDNADGWTVVQAIEQCSGRGRLARTWHSPPGNLYTSTILRPERPTRDWPQLSFVTAVAVADMACLIAPAAFITLKWPNDVLADGRKISGILLETMLGATERAVIIGVGVNIASYPDGTRYGASSLNELTSSEWPIDIVRAHYLRALARWYDIWSAHGFEQIRAAWLQKAHGLGLEVSVTNDDAPEVRGRFTGIGEDGRMLIETGNDAVEFISSGSITFSAAEEA